MPQPDLTAASSADADSRPRHLVHLVALWVIAVVGAVILRRAFVNYVFEDAYITYRYATNLASGAGFTFTPGERVLGTTTPLYTLILSLLGRLGFEVPACGSVLYVIGLGAVGVVGGGILRHVRRPNTSILFALLVMTGFGTMTHFWGMETPLLIALMLGSLLAAMKGRDLLAGVLVALAFLTRYDAALFAIPLYVWLTILRGRIPWRSGLMACGIVIPWLVFAAIYFGDIMPNTLGAKSGDSGFFEYLSGSAKAQLEHAWQFYAGGNLQVVRGNKYLFTLDLICGAAALVAAVRCLRRDPLLSMLFVHAFVLWIAYALIGPPVTFRWYLKPSMFALALLAMIGIGDLLARLPLPRARSLMALVISVAGLIWLNGAARVMADTQTRSLGYRSRVGAYRKMADEIIELGLQDLTLMTGEPGYITYCTGNPAIDAAGLVTKGIRFYGPRNERMSTASLLDIYRPGLAVLHFPARPEGYVLLNSPISFRQLFMRADEHALRFDRIAEEFGQSSADAPQTAGHPFRLDLSHANRKKWRKQGGELMRIGTPYNLKIGGRRVTNPYLNLHGRGQVAQTPRFLIDFDRLSFRFAATHPTRTVAQLVINGRIVLEQGGRHKITGGKFDRIAWPVRSWHGHVAQVRFISETNYRNWVAADDFRSHRDPAAETFDDFEEGDGYRDRWASTFTEPPTLLRQFARDRGVEFMFSKRAALSHGISGEQALVSQPFEIRHDAMSFIWFDHGGELTSIELTIDGEVVQSARGTNAKLLRGLTWDLSPYRGQQAILRVVDADEDPEAGIGIDEILLFNP